MPIVLRRCDICGVDASEMMKAQTTKPSGSKTCIKCQHFEFWEGEDSLIYKWLKGRVDNICQWNTHEYSTHYGRFLEKVIVTCNELAEESELEYGEPKEILGTSGKGLGGWQKEMLRPLCGFGESPLMSRKGEKKGDKSSLWDDVWNSWEGEKSSRGKGKKDSSYGKGRKEDWKGSSSSRDGPY